MAAEYIEVAKFQLEIFIGKGEGGQTSICCMVRSRKVASFRTEMRLLGPTHPMLVPSPPFSFSTTSLSSRDFAVPLGASGMEE